MTTQHYPRSKLQRSTILCCHYLTKRGKLSNLGQISWKQTLRFAYTRNILGDALGTTPHRERGQQNYTEGEIEQQCMYNSGHCIRHISLPLDVGCIQAESVVLG